VLKTALLGHRPTVSPPGVEMDAANMSFTNNDEATKRLTPKLRKGWSH
jgi:hypothetical protein